MNIVVHECMYNFEIMQDLVCHNVLILVLLHGKGSEHRIGFTFTVILT